MVELNSLLQGFAVVLTPLNIGLMFVGIYIASAIYIAVFMIVLGKFPAWKAVVIGVLVSIAFFAMFEVWFKVPLFKGTLDPLAFLGY